MTHDPVVQSLVADAVTYNGLGGPEVISIRKRTVRAPAADEVRIEVKAAAVNPTDILSRTPGYGNATTLLVPGMDAAGIIESVGSGVSRLHVGQAVMAAVSPRRPDGGAQAQYIVVPAASVVPIPVGVSLAEAATLPMNGLTALGALDLAGLQSGNTLAVSGGAGLLAHYAIAVAKRQGIKVIADAKSEEVALVRGYGADIVIERGPAFADAIRREEPAGVDALLDTALLAEKSFGAIRDGGVYIPLRGWDQRPSERQIEIRPFFVDKVLERTDWLELLRDMVAKSEIRLRVTGEYTPDRVADAQRVVEAGGIRGRPVLLF